MKKKTKRKRLLILYIASICLNWGIFFYEKVIEMHISILKNDHNFDPVTSFLGIYSQKIIINMTGLWIKMFI